MSETIGFIVTRAFSIAKIKKGNIPVEPKEMAIQQLIRTLFFNKNEKLNIMVEVDDASLTLVASTPAGKPAVSSINLSITKGD